MRHRDPHDDPPAKRRPGPRTCAMQRTITSFSGGGSMGVDNTNVAAGQQLKLWIATLTAPGE